MRKEKGQSVSSSRVEGILRKKEKERTTGKETMKRLVNS